MGPETANDWTGHANDGAVHAGVNATTNINTPGSTSALHGREYHTDLESARPYSSAPSILRRLDDMATGKTMTTGSLSESGLQHFKTYKYSSVDKSPISYYILRHYVCIFV